VTGRTPPAGESPRPGTVEGWRTRRPVHVRRRGGVWQGLAFVLVAVVVVAAGSWIAFGATLRATAVEMFQGNTGAIRMPFVSDLLSVELADRIVAPAGSDDTPVRFGIEEGQTIAQIEDALVEAGLLRDRLAFQYLVISRGIENRVIAGTYTLDATHTPRDLVERLAGSPDPIVPRVTLALRQGLRIEQVVALAQTLGLRTDLREFHELVSDPPRALRDEYEFLSVVPRGHSLEGFLGAGIFEIPVDITPLELARLLLDAWEEDIGSEILEEARQADRDPYEVMIIASLVERETGRDGERARIAGVYWNRLDTSLNQTRIMNADPTVVYAVDTLALRERGFNTWKDYVFWTTVGRPLAEVTLPADLRSFQTYTQPGLPAWPIASPGLRSILAAIEPNTRRGLLYFYSCPGTDSHVFARNLRQHQRNIDNC
jgi:UPF0755 protein